MRSIYFALLLLALTVPLTASQPTFAATSAGTATGSEKDPFDSVEHLKLPNGLNVYLAPSSDAKLTEIRLEVGVGTETEKGANIGVSHLLEHVLFRDKQLKEEMSYLQLIKEAGGEANGQTEERQTSFFASIPAQKGNWLLDKFAEMILHPEISDDYVTKEKGTVELERGRPSPLASALQFDLLKYLSLGYLQAPGFTESEFGIKSPDSYTLTEEQLSTQHLTTKQVRDHYQNYYYPTNMRLYIAGRFDRAQVMSLIEEKWGTLPARTGLTLPPEPSPHPRLAPYKRTTVTDGTPRVSVGVKLWELSIEDQEIIHSYFEYLAHRLMKEVRNLKGQTYTANAHMKTNNGFGFATLNFEVPSEHFKENLDIAKKYMDDEAVKGALKPEQVAESVKLFSAQYGLMGREADDMMHLAQSTYWIEENFGQFKSPYKLIHAVTPEKYNAVLKKYFTNEHRYDSLSQPPVAFRYDRNLMLVLVAIATFIGLRSVLTKEFHHEQVRWIRKLKFPQLKSLEAVTLIIAVYGAAHVAFVLSYIEVKLGVTDAPALFSVYIADAIETMILLSVVASIISLVPRKLMVMGDQLVIKSLSYFSSHVPLSEIASVTTVRANPFALKRWWSVKHRYAFFNPMFWQRGLLVQLKDGRAYFFGVAKPATVAQELQGFLTQPKHQVERELAPQLPRGVDRQIS